MDETTYHRLADATLDAIAQALEPAYDTGALEELDLAGSVLTITTADGHTFVVSKHAPSTQIWLASRKSGGLHFSYTNERWQLADGRELQNVLAEALTAHGIEVIL
jgi:iron donor protein CyaY